MICIWKRERRERDRQRDKETGRCLILPALFSGMRLRRLGVCRRSRRASRCTDSSLHAGSLLFTKKKKQHSSFIGCSLSADFGITVRSQDSESIPTRFIIQETGRPSPDCRCVISPTTAASHHRKEEDSSSEDHKCEKLFSLSLNMCTSGMVLVSRTTSLVCPNSIRVRTVLERYLNKAQLICRGCSRPSPKLQLVL